MEHETYIYLITALMPLTAAMVVVQVNPYHALVIRGILGGVAALVYAMLGAADVALTEALVGTMLAITLYAVAVRSSLVMRLGVLQDQLTAGNGDRPLENLIAEFRAIFRQYYMRVELVLYHAQEDLHQALMAKEIHATCVQIREPKTEPKIAEKVTVTVGEAQGIGEVQINEYLDEAINKTIDKNLNIIENSADAEKNRSHPPQANQAIYQTNVRLQRLYEIMANQLRSSPTVLNYINLAESGEKN